MASSTSFYVDLQSPNNAITVLPSGNVGVGTTNPQAKLQIGGSLDVQGSLLQNSLLVLKMIYCGTLSTSTNGGATSTITLPTVGFNTFEIRFSGATPNDIVTAFWMDMNVTNDTLGGWISTTSVPSERTTILYARDGTVNNQANTTTEVGHYAGNICLDFQGSITVASKTLFVGSGTGLFRLLSRSVASGNTSGIGTSTYITTKATKYNSQATLNAIRFSSSATTFTTLNVQVVGY